MNIRLAPLFTALVTMGTITLPYADALAAGSDRFGISLAVFITERDSKTRIDGENPGSGTPIDLESDLGLDKSDSVFRVDGYFKFNEKHRLDFSVFDLSRTAFKQIDRDIEWDGEIYPIDTDISALFDLNIYKLAYTWSFLQRDSGYLGVTGGLYIADIGTTLAAESIGQVSGAGVTAPLPVVGMRGEYYFSDKWSFRGSAEIFAVDYGDYSGSLYDIYAGIDYQLFENMALGLGLNSVKLNVGVEKAGFNGDVDWRYDGALAFIKLNF